MGVGVVKSTTFIVNNSFVSASDMEKLQAVRGNIIRMLVKKSSETTGDTVIVNTENINTTDTTHTNISK